MSNLGMKKGKEICDEKFPPKFFNISSTESSESQNDMQRESKKNNGEEFLYNTPIKKLKLNFVPSTPKKEHVNINYQGLVGRNLTIIFESM